VFGDGAELWPAVSAAIDSPDQIDNIGHGFDCAFLFVPNWDESSIFLRSIMTTTDRPSWNSVAQPAVVEGCCQWVRAAIFRALLCHVLSLLILRIHSRQHLQLPTETYFLFPSSG
jgi:hypothetical protein